jgi:hypothetical protein
MHLFLSPLIALAIYRKSCFLFPFLCSHMRGFFVGVFIWAFGGSGSFVVAQWPAPQGRKGTLSEAERLAERTLQPRDGVYSGNLYFTTDDSIKRSSLEFIPWFNVAGGIGRAQGTEVVGRANAGFGLAWKNNAHWSAWAGFTRFTEALPQYLHIYADSLNVFPGAGIRVRDGQDVRSANIPIGTIAYQAGKYFILEAGINKHFWGHGLRSLFLSDASAPYPYAMVTANIGRVKYASLWTQMRDISTGQSFSNARIKYTSMHLLTWNVSRSVQLQFFEGVVWQDRDTLSRRYLDLAYANPVLFFRPVEFAQGSADNVILGLGVRWKWSDRSQVYGQLLLDEFLLSQVRAANGWWGNKFGGQIGFKSVNVGGKNLMIQTEINVLRPFTYTHGSPVQAWGHLNQPLAHPLGANFAECTGWLRWEKKRLTLQLRGMAAIAGRDEPGKNFGGNIFASYRNPHQTFNNTIGQGRRNDVLWQEFTVAYAMKNEWLEWYFTQVFRSVNAGVMRTNEAFGMVGIRVRGLIDTVRDF